MFLPPQTDYSNYLTAFGVTGVVGQVVAIPFLSNKMRWSDTTILIVTTSTAVANQGRAFTKMALKMLVASRARAGTNFNSSHCTGFC